MDDAKPHLIVGVDFGMTCTGMLASNTSAGFDQLRRNYLTLAGASRIVYRLFDDNRKRALTFSLLC